MMKRFALLRLLLLSVLTPCLLRAAEPVALRPVTSTYSLAAGVGRLTDQYLSGLTTSGTCFGVDYERWQAMRGAPDRWSMRLGLSAECMGTTPLRRQGGAKTWDAQIDGAWSAYYRFAMPVNGLVCGVGPEARLALGCAYLGRNSNNPASARAALTAGASGMAVWHQRLHRLPVTLGIRMSVPLLGAMFSPQYGEGYYEIYLGNRDGLVHPAWLGNRFSLNGLVWADLHFGATTLRLGYSIDALSSKVCGLVTNRTVQMAVIGVSCEWTALRPGATTIDAAKIIRAY